jgi:Spy/CpxP family protein refolding chaperone
MQRPKQQALMFLLGAVLVGGALGFSADRYVSHEKFAAQYGPRARFYDELGLTQAQRAALDSLAFQQDCEVKAVLAPHDSALKAIRTRFHAQQNSVFTKEQLTQLDARRKEMDARRTVERAKEPKRTCTGS